MSYFKSENVYMYPSGYRQYNNGGVDISVNPESKLNTEFNLTNIVSRLVTQNGGSFIVSYSQNVIEFFIHGYFFQVKNFTPSGDIYATIRLAKTAITGETDYVNMWELYPYDTNTYDTRNLDYLSGSDINFIALYISNDTPTIPTSDDEYYTLCLSKDGNIPQYSKFKLDLNDIYGGHISAGIKKSALEFIDNTKIITSNLVVTDAIINHLSADNMYSPNINDLLISRDSSNYIKLNNKQTSTNEIDAYIKHSGTIEMSDVKETITGDRDVKSSLIRFYKQNTSTNPYLSLADTGVVSGVGTSLDFNNATFNCHRNITGGSSKLEILKEDRYGFYMLRLTKIRGTENVITNISPYGIETPMINNITIGRDSSNNLQLGGNNVLFSDVVQTITANKRLGATMYLGSTGSSYYINNNGNAHFNEVDVKYLTCFEGTTAGKNQLNIHNGRIYITKVNYSSSRTYIDGQQVTSRHLYTYQLYCEDRAQAGNFFATSDKRLKENIVPFEYSKSILDLPIKRFDFINGRKNNIGCLAQDLQQLYPELVEENEDGYLSIQENKLVYLLMEEIKQLKTIVDKQQVELNKLIN